MKTFNIICLSIIVSIICFSTTVAQDANSSVWGLYASGVGERLDFCMDPCWVTYTVASTSDPNILNAISNGTMAPIVTNVTWREATAQQRRFGRYFDDEPDGTYKCSPCEVPRPNLSCSWSSTYGSIYWNRGYYGSESNTLSGSLNMEDGQWVYRGSWGRTNGTRSGDVVFVFTTANSFDGFWTESGSSQKTSWSGSGDCD